MFLLERKVMHYEVAEGGVGGAPPYKNKDGAKIFIFYHEIFKIKPTASFPRGFVSLSKFRMLLGLIKYIAITKTRNNPIIKILSVGIFVELPGTIIYIYIYKKNYFSPLIRKN